MSVVQQLAKLRRRRGVTRSSVTRLGKKVSELEEAENRSAIIGHAREMLSKLETLNSEFQAYHLELIDLIDDDALSTDEDLLDKEQNILDEHDDQITDIKVALDQFLSADADTPLMNPRYIAPPVMNDNLKLSQRKLSRLQRVINVLKGTINKCSDEEADVSLFELYLSQLSDYKAELSEVLHLLLTLEETSEVQEMITLQSQLEQILFECSHVVRKRWKTCAKSEDISPPRPTSDHSTGVRLPKLEIPTFDGNLLNWRQFWEQFCVAVHDRSHLSNAEKLAYLQCALKDGSAKSIIEGLSQSGEQYEEAVTCLTNRFDRPRLIHQTHVKMILDVPPIREGNGRELRRLHDVIQQHIRALKSMGKEPSPDFITSIIELKFDSTTMFEWQQHSQSAIDVPHYDDILKFIDSRAQASEVHVSMSSSKRRFKTDSFPGKGSHPTHKTITSFATNQESSNCPLCKNDKHPLYSCPKFKGLPYERKTSTVKTNGLCMNCLGKGHFVAQCKSSHRCRKCQRPHHTLLHNEIESQRSQSPNHSPKEAAITNGSEVSATVSLKSSSLLMTCEVIISGPKGSSLKARALLDSGSTVSFVSNRIAQTLGLPRTKQRVTVSGVGGIGSHLNVNTITRFKVSPVAGEETTVIVSALIVPKVVNDLPTAHVSSRMKYPHLQGLCLADPKFNTPGPVDLLLGVDVFMDVLLNGRRKGIPGTPTAVETCFGWVLYGGTNAVPDPHSLCSTLSATTCHTSIDQTGDDILRKFWEIEELPNTPNSYLSQDERIAVTHFKVNHTRTKDGRFMVPLPRTTTVQTLGESRSQAVRRFLSLERSLNIKNKFHEFNTVIQEYFDLQHAEVVPREDLHKPSEKVFYLPMHAVYKQSSTTTKVRAVFDASAKSSSGISLNDTLLNGPTVHPSLIDVLLRFRLYRVAITADVGKMYRAISLTPNDKDYHRFVWRSNPNQPLLDYRMTRVTFGVKASSFAANMSLKQNALDFEHEFPLAAKVVEENVYVDDCLTGTNDIGSAISLHHQLLNLFERGKFNLRKWNSSEPAVLQAIKPELRDSIEVLSFSGSESYTKALGLEWNTTSDQFRLTITKLPSPEVMTKRLLVSNVAKVFDVLGWFSPTIIKLKILLQQLWEVKLDWDDQVPSYIKNIWLRWTSESPVLSNCHVPRYLFPKNVTIVKRELHGFSDASENAYSAVVYIRGKDSNGQFYVELVLAKTRVAPLKRLTIPRLELCGALLLAQLLNHVKSIYQIPMVDVHAWTDSTVVLNWLNGSSKRFKTFVANRISNIVDILPPSCWNHVTSSDNPADCASRGLFPNELYEHHLWWKGPTWLLHPSTEWPNINNHLPPNDPSDEQGELCSLTSITRMNPIIPLAHYSSFLRLQRVTAWIYRFVNNCRSTAGESRSQSPNLTTIELLLAEKYWLTISQMDCFPQEIAALRVDGDIPNNSSLKTLHPFLDPNGIIRVGGRISKSNLPYKNIHPIVLHAHHTITRLLIRHEHLRLLHAGPTLLCASISLRYHIINLRKTSRTICRSCTICRRQTAKPLPQLEGQLPSERVTPDMVFDKIGVDYAGPFNIKYGSVRKPTIVKAYVCVFVSLSVKAVHLEIVSDLTTQAFIATLRRFIARRGHPSLIWSDHGTNFVGASNELKSLLHFLRDQHTNKNISEFCASKGIEWRFIPERSPHFGGLWEAAVKSMKFHLRRVMCADVKLTFEEMNTVISQIEACLNSRPLIPVNHNNEEVVDVLTPGHFLIGRPLTALPDDIKVDQSLSLLRRWCLCQSIVRHFWNRWSKEYIITLNKFTKWPRNSRNSSVGDIVVIRDETLFPTKWPLARVVQVHPGDDGVVRVVTLKTDKGTYKRPITKIVTLVPIESGQL